METIKRLLFILCLAPCMVQGQTLGASQLKKDSYTIKGNASNQLQADTTVLATKYYVGTTGSGTVTSVTGGSGLTGGTITTSGTLKVDTSLIATRTYVTSGASVDTSKVPYTGATRNVNLGSNTFFTTGSIGSTGTRVLKSWFTDLEVTNAPTLGGVAASGTGGLIRTTSPTFITDITTPLIYGSSSSGGNLTLQSTSHATKGKILFGTSGYDEVNNRLGVGLTTPQAYLHVYGGSSDAYPSIIIDGKATANPYYDFRQNGVSKAIIQYVDNGASTDYMYSNFPLYQFAVGNVLIGGTTDNGYKLEVTGTAKVSSDLTLTSNQYLNNTTFASQTGIIYKGGSRFIHDFNYGNNGTVTTSGRNTFIGIDAGNFTMGSTATATYQSSDNIAGGYNSGKALTLGQLNSFYGNYSGLKCTTGSTNSVFGYIAGQETTIGSQNSYFGAGAGYSNISGNGSVCLGYDAGAWETASNAFYINNVNQTNTANDKAYSLMYGTFAGSAGTTTGNTLTVNGNTTINGIPNSTSLTASTILSSDASKNIVSLATATYPSLTELSYVKGVTSAVQTQINTKALLSEVIFSVQLGGTQTSPGASLQYYIGLAGMNIGIYTIQNRSVAYIPYNCTLVGYTANFYVAGTLSSAQLSTFGININGAITNINTSISTSSAINTYNSMALNTDLNAGDYVEASLLTPAWSTSPTGLTPTIIFWFKRR